MPIRCEASHLIGFGRRIAPGKLLREGFMFRISENRHGHPHRLLRVTALHPMYVREKHRAPVLRRLDRCASPISTIPCGSARRFRFRTTQSLNSANLAGGAPGAAACVRRRARSTTGWYWSSLLRPSGRLSIGWWIEPECGQRRVRLTAPAVAKLDQAANRFKVNTVAVRQIDRWSATDRLLASRALRGGPAAALPGGPFVL